MKKWFVLPVLATSTLLTSCVGAPASTYEVAGDISCPVTPSDATGNVRIGYQVISGGPIYLRDQGLVEACLPDAKVSWVRFPTGQDVIQGFVSDSIDFGILGSPPFANGLSKPIDLDASVVYVDSIIRDSEALVAREAKSIEELRGKRIGTGFASTSHYSLLKALEFAGLDPKRDVEIVNLSPDTLAGAWNSGGVDAAFIWGPVLSEIKKTGTTLTTAGEVADKGAPTFMFTVAADKFIDANNDLVDTWKELGDWAIEQYRTNPEDFIQANSVQLGLNTETTTGQLNGADHVGKEGQAELAEEVGEAMYNTSMFLQEAEIATAQDKQHYLDAIRIGR